MTPRPRDLTATYPERQHGARHEFARWREANPQFTSKALLDAWAEIRRAWGLSAPPQRKTP